MMIWLITATNLASAFLVNVDSGNRITPTYCAPSSQGGSNLNDTKPSYNFELESDLRTELFSNSNYEPLQRPSADTSIRLSVALLTVNSLDIKEQKIIFSGYLHVEWQDDRLNWLNPNSTSMDYSDIPFLFSRGKVMWTPPLVISNSVTDISVIGTTDTPIRIHSDGTVAWNPSGLFAVSCESSTTYFPLDIQTCTIKISIWSYSSSEVNLEYLDDPIDLNSYVGNGEWDLVSVTTNEIGTEIEKRRSASFSSLSFSVSLKRRPLFYILNTVLPVFMMAMLIAAVFKVPVDSGERMGFSLTVLLAYALYLIMISGYVPSTSITVCYLSLYLLFTLVLGTVAVKLSIVVLSLYYKPETEEVSPWIIRLLSLLNVTHNWKSCCLKRDMKVRTTKDTEDEIDIAKYIQDKQADRPITWRDVARNIDRVAFAVYVTLIVIATMLYLIAIVQHYLTVQ